MSGIHQFVPMLHRGDAVGRHTLALRDLMVERGIPSRIYVEMVDPDTATETALFATYAEDCEPGDILIYQFATASGIAGWLAGREEPLVLNYHNVTPPEHYAYWDNGLARHQQRAREELRALAPRTTLGVAVSAYNEAELRSAGYARTAVVPPAAMLPTHGRPPVARPDRPGARWICVGRLAPNKSLQHAVMALLVARAHHDPAASLTLVGDPVLPAYTAALHRFVDQMGLHDVVSFRGQVTDLELVQIMSTADVLVVTSSHEGFGVPVIEAMTLGLPVVANRAGALPDVVGEAGVLVDTSDPWALAGAITTVLRDPDLRDRLQEAALARMDVLDLASAGARMVDLVGSLGPAHP